MGIIFVSGLYVKDLISISEGNSDYIHGGLVNVHKRRQVCRIMMKFNGTYLLWRMIIVNRSAY